MTSGSLTQGEQMTDSAAQGYIVPLDRVARADAARVGWKAATLGELHRAGLPVPYGVIVTTHAWETALSAGREIDPSAPGIQEVSVPLAVRHELLDALKVFGDQPLAVRSSAVAEDLPGSSYAGQ